MRDMNQNQFITTLNRSMLNEKFGLQCSSDFIFEEKRFSKIADGLNNVLTKYLVG